MKCSLCEHDHEGRCREDAPNAQFQCSCPGECLHGQHPAWCRECTAARIGAGGRPEMDASHAARAVELFVSGEGMNHICFLFEYKYSIDQVSQAVRERLKSLMEARALTAKPLFAIGWIR